MTITLSKLGFFALLTLPLIAFASSASAQIVENVHLRITLDAAKSRKAPKGKKKASDPKAAWNTACTQLGDAMALGKGPWGFGVFSSFDCYRGKTRTSGETIPADKASYWALNVIDGAKEVSFTLSHRGQVVADVRMPPSESTLSFFQDDEFTDLVAFNILSSMPIGARVMGNQVKGKPPRFNGRHWRAGTSRAFKYDVPQPPAELIFYRLRWDNKSSTWRSDVIGTARRTKIVEPKTKTTGKKKILVGGSVQYETSDQVAEALGKHVVWAQDAAGPNARQKELVGILQEAQLSLDAAAKSGQLADFMSGAGASLVANLLQTAASGYVGLRYGLQVLPADGELGKLLSKTSIFSLLAEVRGGPLKGLRYYYDKLPEAKATLEAEDGSDVEAKLAFSRHTLGASIGFEPGFLVDRLTIDPKIGMWEFHAQLPTDQNDEGKVVRSDSFEIGRTFSLAAEVGAELLSSWYTLRGWYAIDTGFSVLKSGGRVTSNRLGVDAYFTAGPVFPVFGVPFKTALLAFYVYEAVSIEAVKKEDPAPGEDAISGIDYTTGYAGGGIAISW